MLFYTVVPEQLCQLLLLRHNTPDFCKHLKLVFWSQVCWIGFPVQVMCAPNPAWIWRSEIEFLVSLKLSVGVIFREKSLNILSHRCILEVCVNFAKGITLRDSALCIIQVWHKYQKHSFLCVLYVNIGTPHTLLFSYIYHQRNLKFIEMPKNCTEIILSVLFVLFILVKIPSQQCNFVSCIH